MYRAISLATALIASVRAQQACTSTQETHPPLTWSKCTESGCTEVSGSVVVDANRAAVRSIKSDQDPNLI